METFALDSHAVLEPHALAIERLFTECFGSRMSSEVWRWAYLHNPQGHPWVTVCYDGDAMVGHYAMIPMNLRTARGDALRTCLSMTTMVAASHRQHGLFVKLATGTYERACADGVAWVMGFPNDMSAPGFERRLGWTLGEPDRIVTARGREWCEHLDTLQPDPALARLDLRDAAVRAWRLSRPGANYEWDDGLAWKQFGDAFDVMAFDAPQQLARLPAESPVNLLLPASHPCSQRFAATPYRFGGAGLTRPFDAGAVLRQLALSDVF